MCLIYTTEAEGLGPSNGSSKCCWNLSTQQSDYYSNALITVQSLPQEEQCKFGYVSGLPGWYIHCKQVQSEYYLFSGSLWLSAHLKVCGL